MAIGTVKWFSDEKGYGFITRMTEGTTCSFTSRISGVTGSNLCRTAKRSSMNRGRVERDPKPPTCARLVSGHEKIWMQRPWSTPGPCISGEATARSASGRGRDARASGSGGATHVRERRRSDCGSDRSSGRGSGCGSERAASRSRARPEEWSVLDPGEDLAPGSRHIGTVGGVCAEPSDEGSGSAGLETCDLRIANCEEWGA